MTDDDQKCSTPRSQLGREVTIFFVTSRFEVISDTLSRGSETHNDCVSGATSGPTFENVHKVAGSIGNSAPTDPDHFLMVRFAVVISQQRWTYAHCTSWQMVDH